MRTVPEIQKDIDVVLKAWDLYARRPNALIENDFKNFIEELRKEIETSDKYWQHWKTGEKMFKALYYGSGYKRKNARSYGDMVYEFSELDEAEQIPFINAGLELGDILD